MKPIETSDRLVQNICDARFEPFETDGEIEEVVHDQEWLYLGGVPLVR